MPEVGRFLRSFQGLLWLVCVGASLFILGYPLAMNLWAYYTWQRVPCWLTAEHRFIFEYEGIQYYGEAPDFWWGMNLKAGRAAGAPHPESNTFCYMNPGTPPEAVLTLETHKHLERAAPRVGVVGLLVVATGILSYASRNKAGGTRKRGGGGEGGRP